jgi:hypothetical protein
MAKRGCGWSAWVVAVSVLLGTGSAVGQELGVRGGVSPIGAKGRFSIVSENDLYYFGFGPGTDRLYTNGIFLHSEWSSPWVDGATDWMRIGRLFPARDRAYIGLGLSHELHTPETLNPCGSYHGDPLATSDNPGTYADCEDLEADWSERYAERDRPFAAVGSVFLTAQRYFATTSVNGPFTQARLWARLDVGSYGSSAVAGRQVQTAWHSFFNTALLKDGEAPAEVPKGWELSKQTSRALVQAALGTDLSLYRLTTPTVCGPFGVELDGRARLQLGVPRNTVGVGPAARVGCLPDHASMPLNRPGELQSVELYLEGSTGIAVVVTDLTYGDFDRYHHLRDEHSLGATLKLFGIAVEAQLDWQRIDFENPLKQYDSLEPLDARYHRYGRVALEFTY